MSPVKRRRLLRSALTGDECRHPASVYDPVSARLAQRAGFEIGMVAGSIASFSILGDPDIILLTLTELADQTRRIGRACDLPLLVDADHGYGNAINVMRTVEELESAGVAGLTIEDTWLPAPHGVSGKGRVIPIEEGVGKMAAALAARSDPGLVVVGRTSALQITGLDDTLKRIAAYEGVGVDAIFLAGVQSLDELDRIAATVSLPLILGPTAKAVTDDVAGMADRRVRLCLQGHLPFSAAVKALDETYRALADGTPPDQVDTPAPDALMKAVTAQDRFAGHGRAFMGVP